MSMIHFVGGEKGGVGKSVTARLLSQYFLDKPYPYIGLDADQSHPTLTRYYQDFTRPLNLDFFEQTDAIMELALEENRHILVDLPAQSQRFLDRWIEENGVLELCVEMQIPLLYWYAVDGGRDSVQLLDNFLTKYADKLRCIVVKNQGCGSDFTDIETLLKHTSANTETDVVQHIALPALHAPTMRKIDKQNLSFWAAINLTDSSVPHLSFMERQRARVWMKKAYSAFDTVL